MEFKRPDDANCIVCLSFEFDAESVELGFYKPSTTAEIGEASDPGSASPVFWI